MDLFPALYSKRSTLDVMTVASTEPRKRDYPINPPSYPSHNALEKAYAFMSVGKSHRPNPQP